MRVCSRDPFVERRHRSHTHPRDILGSTFPAAGLQHQTDTQVKWLNRSHTREKGELRSVATRCRRQAKLPTATGIDDTSEPKSCTHLVALQQQPVTPHLDSSRFQNIRLLQERKAPHLESLGNTSENTPELAISILSSLQQLSRPCRVCSDDGMQLLIHLFDKIMGFLDHTEPFLQFASAGLLARLAL